MALYVYEHPQTGEQFEDMRPFSEADTPFIAPDGTECPRNPYPSSVGVIDKNAEIWKKDPDYVKKMKPKFLRLRDGRRVRYDPTRHR